jgi:hypothetical protein
MYVPVNGLLYLHCHAQNIHQISAFVFIFLYHSLTGGSPGCSSSKERNLFLWQELCPDHITLKITGFLDSVHHLVLWTEPKVSESGSVLILRHDSGEAPTRLDLWEREYLSHRSSEWDFFSVALACKQTIPIERPPIVGEVSANFCG